MAKSREKKQSEVSALSEKFGRMKVAVFSTTAGLKVKDANQLRTILRNEGIDHVVAKKTLIKRAIEQASLTNIDVSPFTQSMAITFGYNDEVTPAKLLAVFAKTHESLTFLGGIMERSLLSADQVKALALLPSRNDLFARIACSVAAPLSGFVRVISGNITGLVRVLDGYRSKHAGTPVA
ncbi:MAG: 50S ribosomal protein L10 [Candidatus Kerfeldbacteria bacterium]